ncbi:DUF302 domain-containing protein [Methylophaga sp. OBS3]|uniref:DUF302 domain-containing protein n=1 Tax=Methylophaga sp. OBS3 TaxID=2991934 RepID=UPI00225B5BDC|nr:DUF302 domain-containing protein [Methylophaga sp. OBS3]MCX4190789.1 DUF302 domain-containing protein [Methylophaga sp. OBS3]
MTILKRPKILIAIICFVLLSACQPDTSDRYYQSISPYNFAETMQSLDIAISEFNYRIIHRSDIGQAIRDRGEENFPLSTIVSFCNITYAHEMMLINDNLINDMPCNAAVRETEQGVIVSSRLMDETAGTAEQQAFAKKINNNLKKIIEAATL